MASAVETYIQAIKSFVTEVSKEMGFGSNQELLDKLEQLAAAHRLVTLVLKDGRKLVSIPVGKEFTVSQ